MNERDNREDSTPTQPLTDLPVSPEQAEETKAGVLGGGGAGKVHVHDVSITG
jgi:hypothetical protein